VEKIDPHVGSSKGCKISAEESLSRSITSEQYRKPTGVVVTGDRLGYSNLVKQIPVDNAAQHGDKGHL
jgi:hypothetical protein